MAIASPPDGFTYCWGYHGYGQLGNGTTTALSNALPVGPIVMKAFALATAQSHSCVVATSHEV
jgi:hypothetical protein